MNELEKLIALSKVVAKPLVIATSVLAGLMALSVDGYVILMLNKKKKKTTKILAGLLALSVAGNVYLMLNAPEVTMTANDNSESTITQSNE